MALQRHDSAASLKSADRFGDAMRVLRRSSRDVLVPRRPADSMVVSETRSSRPPVVVPSVPGVEATPIVHRGPTAAQRRVRTLITMLGISWLSLFLVLLHVPGALYVHVVADLLLVAFVVHLRRQALLRAQRKAAEAHRARPAPRPRVRVEGIPVQMPARPAPLTQPLPIPAARYEDKPLVAAAAPAAPGGAPWSPVPVPPPMYVGKAAAPRRLPRVLDLTKPGEWTAALEGDDSGADWAEDGRDLEDILDRRRTANGW